MFIVSNTIFLVLKSIEFVDSSNTKISDFLYKALAIPIRCFSPPEIFDPLSPKYVNSFSGKYFKKFSKLDCLNI